MIYNQMSEQQDSKRIQSNQVGIQQSDMSHHLKTEDYQTSKNRLDLKIEEKCNQQDSHQTQSRPQEQNNQNQPNYQDNQVNNHPQQQNFNDFDQFQNVAQPELSEKVEYNNIERQHQLNEPNERENKFIEQSQVKNMPNNQQNEAQLNQNATQIHQNLKIQHKQHQERQDLQGISQPINPNLQPNKQENAIDSVQNDPNSTENEPKNSIVMDNSTISSQFQIRSSSIIIKQAEKDRISSTYNFFRNFNFEFQKTVNSYKLIIKNVASQIIRKKEFKKETIEILKDYFQNLIKINKDFHDKCYKVQKEEPSFSNNKFVNMKQELKAGFEACFYLKKDVANQTKKLQNYTQLCIIKSINDAYEDYLRAQNAQQKKQALVYDQYNKRQKSLQKLIVTLDKIFKKGMDGSQKQDILMWILKYINEEKQYRISLVKYGKTVIQLRQTFVQTQKQLLMALQRIINDFKCESRKLYTFKTDSFTFVKDYLLHVEQNVKYEHLCTITDVDYIKSVLELHNRKEFIQFTNEHFLNYLDLPFFDRIVGNKKDLFKGAMNKSFALQRENEVLIHTISGNLIQFNKQTEQCKQKFNIANLNVRLFGEGGLQFDQIIKKIIFNENRTVRIKMLSNDVAQQLICYLNEKEKSLQDSILFKQK